jgi:hypothetical protein
MAATPTKRGTAGARRLYRSRKAVIAALRERLLQGKTIQARRVLKDDISLHAAVIRYFGNFAEAHAHFRAHPPRETRWHRAEEGAIISEIRRRQIAGETLSCKKIGREKLGTAFLNRTKALFGRWSDAVVAAGFEPYEGAKSPWPHADRVAILTEIRRRKRGGKSLRAKKVAREKWGQPLTSRARQLFGSWSEAMRAAGLQPNKRTRTWWVDADKAAIMAWIRRRRRKRESLRLAKVRKVKHARGLLYRCDKLFGSWNAALLATGVEPARENSPWRRANKAAVLAEIRQRRRAGQSLIAKQVIYSKWGSPLVLRANVLFGSWRNALLSAGINDWLRADSDYRFGSRRQPSLRVRRVVRRGS